MEKIIVDIALMVVAVVLIIVPIGASIGAADGGRNPSWAWPIFITGVAMFLLGAGLLSIRVIAAVRGLWG